MAGQMGGDQLATLVRQARAGRLSRREVLRRALAVGLSGSACAALLAACGGAGDGGQPATTAPAASSPPLATTGVGGGTGPTAGATARAAGTPGGRIAVGVASDPATMDPHKSTSVVDRQVYQLVFDKLVDIDEKLNIVPQLATRWQITNDGKTYTLTLAEGVQFHDGTPFNAQAVKVNLERMLDRANASPRRGEIEQVTAVEAPDPKTVVLTLSQPYAPLLATFSDRAGMMMSPKALAEKGDDIARQPVGTGPFAFVEWVKNDHLTLKKNPNYWQRGLPYLDEVTYRPITEGTQRLNGLKTNQLQMIDSLPPKDIEATKKDQSLRLDEVPSLAFSYVTLQVTRPPFDNKALRQAFAWAIDREAINQVVFFGSGQAGQTAIPPSSWAFDPAIQPYRQDYAMARRKLEEGGQPNGFSFTMLITNSPESVQLAEAYKAQLQEVKIVANLEQLEGTAFTDRSNKGLFDGTVGTWSGRPDPDGNIYNYCHSSGGLNRGGYKNPEVDRLLEQARASGDTAERKRLYSQVSTIVADEAPHVFLRYPAEIKVWRPTVQGFVHIPDGMMRLKSVSLQG